MGIMIPLRLAGVVLLVVTLVTSSIFEDYLGYEDVLLDSSESDDVSLEIHPLSDDMINHINSVQKNWTVSYMLPLLFEFT